MFDFGFAILDERNKSRKFLVLSDLPIQNRQSKIQNGVGGVVVLG